MKKKRKKGKKKRKWSGRGSRGREEQQCRPPLVGCFNGQMSLFSCAILRESSSRHKEHFYNGLFRFRRLDL